MDCGPEFFAMMSFQAAYYNMSDFRVICFFSSFFLFTGCSSNLKTSSAPEGHPYYMGWRFASLPPTAASTPVQTHNKMKQSGEAKAAQFSLERCCSYHSILCASLMSSKILISQWWHLRWMMLLSSSILWIQCLKRFSKICSGQN